MKFAVITSHDIYQFRRRKLQIAFNQRFENLDLVEGMLRLAPTYVFIALGRFFEQ